VIRMMKTAEEIRALIRAAKDDAPGTALTPFVLDEPISLSIEFFNSVMADHAMRMPDAAREGTRVSLSLPDMVTAYNAFQAMVALATLV